MIRRILLTCAAFCVLASCMAAPYELNEKTLCPVLPKLQRIAVAPFELPAGSQNGLSREGKIDEGAAEKVATFAEEGLKRLGCFDVVTWEELIDILQRSDRGMLAAAPVKDMKVYAIEVGKVTRADAVLMGFVTIYRDRVGKKYGVTRPASVGYTLSLVSAVDGSVLWSANYRETQTSLAENLFGISLYFQRGMKWLTSDELAKWGIHQIMKTFPGAVKE